MKQVDCRSARYEAHYDLIENPFALGHCSKPSTIVHGSLASRESAHDRTSQDRRVSWNGPWIRLFVDRRALAQSYGICLSYTGLKLHLNI